MNFGDDNNKDQEEARYMRTYYGGRASRKRSNGRGAGCECRGLAGQQ
jgi:hypothetical protein